MVVELSIQTDGAIILAFKIAHVRCSLKRIMGIGVTIVGWALFCLRSCSLGRFGHLKRIFVLMEFFSPEHLCHALKSHGFVFKRLAFHSLSVCSNQKIKNKNSFLYLSFHCHLPLKCLFLFVFMDR